ncbi:hypothetical protein QVD17_38160 [Tagetes erecta]|uniref:Uncharacterized protein n=1 Tax=Tagetes erecta TaxID=13708 RepID=A0AAD8JVA6_TARER|nr:hypothetical protein QVD17_38160 [Tagetes erecta]
MNDLKFEPKHNLVAVLDESIPEADGYRDMIRLLRRTKYVYAMCAKPIVYARLIKSFWRTAEVITDEAGVSVVRGNISRHLQITVSEESIRTTLRLDEEEVGAPDEYTTAECQACFMNMGHPPVVPKQQLVRARLGKQWKLLCYVIQQCLSRRSAGFDNFLSDIASPIVAIATNRPFNMSRWIMKGFIFNLVKGKRFKFLMYPRFLQLLINIAHPVIREEGVNGDLLMTEDMNALSYRKMSIGNVAEGQMFDYMRDIANNEEDIGGIYHHISQGEVIDPLDLMDEIPDNLLDDDEYFARHLEDEGDNDEDDNGDEEDNDEDNGDEEDGNEDDDNNDDENVVDSDEEIVVESECDEVEKEAESVVLETPKDITIAQEVVAEVEIVSQTVDETEAVEFVPDTRDIATSSAPATEYSKQPKESSSKVGLDVDMNEEEECNTLRAEKEVLEKWLKEEEPESSESDKEFVLDEDVGVSETPRDVTVYYTRSRRSKTVTEPIVESVSIPDDAAAIVTYDKAEGKRKLDEVPEIVEEDVSVKKARTEEAVQVEPVQAKTLHASEVMNISDEVDFSDSETEVNVDEEIPIDLDARFAYLERMKYNPVYLNGLTVIQINKEYEKCINAQDKADGDEKEIVSSKSRGDDID